MCERLWLDTYHEFTCQPGYVALCRFEMDPKGLYWSEGPEVILLS